ncbi:RNA exonuclease 1 homolog isoform X2 [Sabethes cyaneus]|uniref:RNA exonuclease 1 homolog isoform X2 n=1 Tax=Sabethes cyaneus TaxID=53552 RepID=UPI00237EA869|nr:RNA exonuclease 1 homolog isoform X2 [Sabethes cyaneus]
MLPATGLFRSINCPFFEKDLCTRAYCHFKHIKSVPAAATYSATPKSILNRTSNERPDITGSDVPAKKKPKLEYIPMPTVIAPKYVPSVKAVPPITEELTRNESAVEIPAIKKLDSSIKADNTEPTCEIQPADGEHNKSNVEHNEANKEHNEDGRSRNGYNKIEIIAKDNDINPTELSAATTISSEKESTESSVAATVEKDKPIERSSSRKSSSSHTSSSSHKKSSREDKHHRRHESSSKTEKKTSSSRSHTSDRKHSSSSRNEERVSNSKTEIKDKHREKTHEKSKSREKCRESDRRSSRDTNSSSKSDQNRHRSSHSSTKSRTKSCSISKHTDKSSKSTKTETKERKPSSTSLQSSSSKSKLALADKIYLELLDNPPSDIDGESDEDEVMKQCKMIFEEYDSTSSKISDHEKPKTVQSQKPELIDMFAEKYYDENRKKRVAHENVSNVKSSSSIPVTKKPNHVQNAMRSVYHRQEIVRKQQEELAAKIRLEEEAKARIEEETRKAISKPVTPRLSNGSPRSPVVSPTSVNTLVAEKSPVSPINTTSFYNKSPDAIAISMTPKSRFAPAVNVLALQKAKEKIEELKKLKGISTPAQTAPKGLGRKAHVGSVLPESASSSSSSAVPSPSKPAPPVLEPESTKISYNIRMQFYNLMVQHCVSIYSSLEDAWDRAQTEELSVLKKCNTPMIYKKSALLTVNKLRKEAGELGNKVADRNKTVSHDVILAGKMGQNISWSVNKKIKTEVKSAYTIDNAPSTVAYKMIYECIMTEEQLQSNGFPRATEITGQAKIFTSKPRRPPNEDERYCSRCSKVYNLESYDEPAVDSCNYHNKSTCYRRGFADNLHSCCQQPSGSAGCMYANYHVTSYMDYDNLTGFVKTMDPPEGYVPSKKDVYALDCEMCYTTAGLELTRVTVVDINEKTVYDTLVKPSNRVIDYNTRFSGITEQMLIDITTNLYNVQAVLLSMFNSETILIGHSLESDFKALKLIHDTVVDTSILYPHKMGPPKKRALKTLCIENLKKIIQENDAGHDSAEDSVVCIQLIKHYLSNRIL